MIMQFRINRTSIVEEKSDGETTLVHLDSARYFTLDARATVFWDIFEYLQNLAALQAWAQLKFTDEDGSMRANIKSFIDHLLEHELLLPVPYDTELNDAPVLPRTGPRQTFRPLVLTHGPNLMDLEMAQLEPQEL